MNAKHVSFSDVNDIFTIPHIEGTKKLMFPWKKERVLYSDEDLKEQIQRRRERAIRDAKKRFLELERQYKELQKYVQELDENDEDDLPEYDMYVNMIEENFYEQSAVTRQLIALFTEK